jgi:hypothetical protein
VFTARYALSHIKQTRFIFKALNDHILSIPSCPVAIKLCCITGRDTASAADTHHGGPDSIPGQCLWDLWPAERRCIRFGFECYICYKVPHLSGENHFLLRTHRSLFESKGRLK